MVVRLSERLNASGMPTEVAILDQPGQIAEMLRECGVTVHSIAGRGPLATAARLARFLRANDYDVINAYGFRASMLVRLLRRPLRLRAALICGVQGLHVTEVEDLGSAKSRFAKSCERYFSSLVDHYEINSFGAIEFLAGCGIGREKMTYIPMGVDTDAWPVRPAAPMAARPTIACIARFVPRKRQEDLIRALAILRKDGVEFRAVLAGEGPTRAAVQQLARELDVETAVEFPGSLATAAVRSLLQEANVVVLCSTWEGMPTVILEAMASGAPVVGTSVNGTSDLVVDGITGTLVPPRDPDALAAALTALLADYEATAAMTTAARSIVEDQYSVTAMVKTKRSLYEACAPRGGPEDQGDRSVT